MTSSRTHQPAPGEVPAKRCFNDPIDTLADLVIDGVSGRLNVAGGNTRKIIRTGKEKVAKSGALSSAIKARIKKSLQQVLTADNAAGLSLRMDLIATLARVGRDASMPEETDDKTAPLEDPLLSTEAAAKILGFSRTYVAMLIDNDQLPGAYVSAGGHRRVAQSVVLAYQAKKEAKKKGQSTDYRTAGKAAGMYDVSEQVYIDAARRPDSGPLRTPVAKSGKV
jgi:excisionase family DNA binding protein